MDRRRDPVRKFWGIELVQTAQPRDLGALALVIGLFLILLVVTILAGGPNPIL